MVINNFNTEGASSFIQQVQADARMARKSKRVQGSAPELQTLHFSEKGQQKWKLFNSIARP